MRISMNRRTFIQSVSTMSAGAVLGATAGAGFALAHPQAKRVGGSKLKTSLNAYSFNKLLTDNAKTPGSGISLFDLLDFCAKSDFDAIDPTGYFFPGYPAVPTDIYINEFKRRAFELGLDISGTGVKNNFAEPNPQKRAADVKLVKEWIEVAAKLGAPVIRVFAGPIPQGYENRWDEVAKWMVSDLKECADHGEAFGVLVGVQNHGDFLRTADGVIKIVKMVDSEWFGTIVDTGFFLIPDPYVDIAKVMPYCVNLQIKESPFGAASPIRIDMKRLIKILRDSGYRGYCPIETLLVKGQEEQYKPYERVPRFLQELQKAIEETA
jgi:sugar phosphate isomerase/epimerase